LPHGATYYTCLPWMLQSNRYKWAIWRF